ncbi:MAG: NTPase [Desulfurococcaceae archaeon]
MIKYVITGKPGVGKSTLFNNIVKKLVENKVIVGGIKTPEVRDERGFRIGFKIVDLITGREAWLARVNYNSNIYVGKYGIVVNEARDLIVNALERAINESNVIGIDEIGPMELKIGVFRDYLLKILELNKPLILVVHYRLNDPVILSKLSNSKRFELTYSNREILNKELPYKILIEITSMLK